MHDWDERCSGLQVRHGAACRPGPPRSREQAQGSQQRLAAHPTPPPPGNLPRSPQRPCRPPTPDLGFPIRQRQGGLSRCPSGLLLITCLEDKSHRGP